MVNCKADRSGFSLVELVSILTIMFIVGALVVSRANGSSGKVVAEAATLRSHIRFAQAIAIANNTVSWSLTFAAGSYTLLRDGAASPISLPGEDANVHSFARGVQVTSGTGAVTLDDRGSPGAADYSIVLNGTETITIVRDTGFVQ